MAVVEVTVVPIGSEGSSLSKYIKKALSELENTDVKYELTPTGTVLEGDLDEVLEVAKSMHESVFDEDVSRVVTTLQIDERKDKELSIEGKKESVEERIEE